MSESTMQKPDKSFAKFRSDILAGNYDKAVESPKHIIRNKDFFWSNLKDYGQDSAPILAFQYEIERSTYFSSTAQMPSEGAARFSPVFIAMETTDCHPKLLDLLYTGKVVEIGFIVATLNSINNMLVIVSEDIFKPVRVSSVVTDSGITFFVFKFKEFQHNNYVRNPDDGSSIGVVSSQIDVISMTSSYKES